MSKWEWKKLKDVCEIEFGTRVVRKKDGGSIYPVYGGGGATFKMDSFNREDCLIVSRFAMSPQCTRIVKGKFFLNDSGLSLKSKDLSVLSEQYLNSIILGINDDIYALGRGTAQRNLNVEAFKELNIPIPPLSEQKRIVKFLDEEFSKIDTLKTNAETNLKNAKELFETTLEKELNPLSRHSERSEESSAELPSGWEWKKLGDLFKMVRGPFGGSLKKECFKKEGHPVYEQQNAIYSKFEFRYFIDDKKFEEMSRFRVEPGDFIMSCSGTMGKVAIVPPESSVGIINQALLKMSPQKGIISTYAKYYMMNSSFVDSLLKNAQGVAIKNVAAVKELKLIPFALPPLSVQKEIVARLDKLSENVKHLEVNYKQIIANCDELKKSILKKTFEGDSRSSRE